MIGARDHEQRGAPPSPGLSPEPSADDVPPSTTNGFAIASLVLGIVWIYWIGSILALIFGYIAKSQIERSNGRQSGKGLAIAGIVLGWIGVGVLALLIALVVAGASSSRFSFNDTDSPRDSNSRVDSSGSAATTDQAEVRRVIGRYAQATRDKDYRTLCGQLYSSELLDRIRATGLPCDVALRTGMEDRENVQLRLLGVELIGETASARVRWTARGEMPSVDAVPLAKESDIWKVTSLSDAGSETTVP
jgi:hypothetical protein